MHQIAVSNSAYMLHEYRRRLRTYRRMLEEQCDRKVLFNFVSLIEQSRRAAIYWSQYAKFYS